MKIRVLPVWTMSFAVLLSCCSDRTSRPATSASEAEQVRKLGFSPDSPKGLARALQATELAPVPCSAKPLRPMPSPKGPDRPETPLEPETRSPFRSFAVYALSRAKGVPPEAREALRRVRELVEGDRSRGLRVRVETKRIGIEGETRVCAEYEDPKDAGRAFERVAAFVKGVNLVNLAVEPCDEPAAPGERKKEEAKP